MKQDDKTPKRRKFFKVLRRATQVALGVAAVVRIIDFLMVHWPEIIHWLS